MLRALLIVIALTATARAELPAATPDTSYSGAMLLADGVAFAAIVVGGDQGGSEAGHIALGGLAAYLVAGPIVHLAYDNKSGAARSALLRLSLPIAGGLAGWALFHCRTNCDDGTNDGEYEALGGLGGAVLAALVDDIYFGHTGWTPIVAPARNGGATLGIGGAF